MSPASSERATPALGLADVTLEFGLAIDAWIRRTSVSSAGETVARLRLLNELHCNGPQKMADLADSLGVTPRNVTALVDALEAEKMVQRVAHPTDRRVTMVEITGGSSTVEQRIGALRAEIAGLFRDIAPQDRAAFERVVSYLLEKIEPTYPAVDERTAGKPLR